MADIGSFSHFLNFDLHFFQMVEQAKILPMQKRNMNAIPKLFILHLRADLCCGQTWRIQYGQESRILSLEPI